MIPRIIWMIPAIITAHRNNSNTPIFVTALNIIAVKPAAGPLTLKFDLLNEPITIPPTIPEIKPENNGAPEASAIPKHKGSAIKNTTNPDDKSDFKFVKILFDEVINFKFCLDKKWKLLRLKIVKVLK